MCSGYGCSLYPNIFLSEHFCVPGHFQATSVLLFKHFWGPKGGCCSSGEAAAGEEQWHCKMHFKVSVLMPQRKLLCVLLYFSAKHTQLFETTVAQLMCLRVLLVDIFVLHKLMLFVSTVSTAELSCLQQNSSCITFVCVYPLKNWQLLQVGFARCVG